MRVLPPSHPNPPPPSRLADLQVHPKPDEADGGGGLTSVDIRSQKMDQCLPGQQWERMPPGHGEEVSATRSEEERAVTPSFLSAVSPPTAPTLDNSTSSDVLPSPPSPCPAIDDRHQASLPATALPAHPLHDPSCLQRISPAVGLLPQECSTQGKTRDGEGAWQMRAICPSHANVCLPAKSNCCMLS